MTKTIGILGGMGSFATLHFFKTLLELSEPDEFRIVIDNAVHILERTKAVKEGREKEITIEIIRSFGHLRESGADFVVAPCNQVHYWHDRIADMYATMPPPWLNMIEIVSDTVTKKGYSRPLILGGYVTVTKKLYSEYLPGAVYPSSKQQEIIEQMIVNIKRVAASLDRGIYKIINNKRPRIDCIVLACTELPLLDDISEFGWAYGKKEIPIIDSSLELAKATIKYARGE